MSNGARPEVVLTTPHNASAEGIPFHVCQSSPQAIRCDQAGEEAVLPQMANPPGTSIVILRITSRHAAHQQTEGIRPFRYRNEMNVIGHQAIAQEVHAGFGEV